MSDQAVPNVKITEEQLRKMVRHAAAALRLTGVEETDFDCYALTKGMMAAGEIEVEHPPERCRSWAHSSTNQPVRCDLSEGHSYTADSGHEAYFGGARLSW